MVTEAIPVRVNHYKCVLLHTQYVQGPRTLIVTVPSSYPIGTSYLYGTGCCCSFLGSKVNGQQHMNNCASLSAIAPEVAARLQAYRGP
jgi:hypothetical protein